MRRPHYLTSNVSHTMPSRIVFLDVETKATPIDAVTQRHTLRLGVACFLRRRGSKDRITEEWCTFTTPNAFWDWLVVKLTGKTRTILTTHNLNFDLCILNAFSELPQRGFTLSSFYSKGITTIAQFTRNGVVLDCLDNANFFPGRLADLGHMVGLEKLEVDFAAVSDDELARYCRRDVGILKALWSIWLKFLQEHDLGKFRKTLPAQAFGAFQHRFMTTSIWIHDNEKALALERDAYHGGRVEVFRVGTFDGSRFYKLDVNSMYPYVMKANLYPIGLAGYAEDPTAAFLQNKLKRYHVIADCEVSCPLPLFPYKHQGYTCYPVGLLRLALTTSELQKVLAVGSILKVHRIAWYRPGPVFTDYVDFFYSLKQRYDVEDNAPFRAIAKGFLNFLYGKFGQRGLRDDVVGDCPIGETRIVPCVDVAHSEVYDLIYLGGKIIRRSRENESYNSFPAVAAEVTANARLYLWRLIEVAGKENVLYCDTDSLIVNEVGYKNLSAHVDEAELGKLKLQGTADNVAIYAPKDYRFGGRAYIKGIRDNAVPLGESVFQQARFPSIQGLLHSEDMAHYDVTTIEKRLRRQIHSGIVTESGLVQPFVFPLP